MPDGYRCERGGRVGVGAVTAPDGVTRVRKPRVSTKGEQTRARLVAAARTLLGGDGTTPFTTRNAAALGGVTHGMCHHHFANRTDLVTAVIEDVRGEWILPVEEAVDAPGGFAERAERVIAFLGQSEGRELARLFSSVHWIAVTDERVRTVWEAEYRRWRAAFVRLFQVLADELGNGLDPRPLGDAVAAAARRTAGRLLRRPARARRRRGGRLLRRWCGAAPGRPRCPRARRR